jgi:hypothetical protein
LKPTGSAIWVYGKLEGNRITLPVLGVIDISNFGKVKFPPE